LPLPPPLEWTACAEPDLKRTECATLGVPLDYANPGRGTVQIAVSRVAASNPAGRIGAVLINPGGPGHAGRSQAPIARDGLASNDLPEVLARFDLIGFDPRGVGASTAVDCGDVQGYQGADFTPDDASGRQALEGKMRDFVASCEEHTGSILEFVDSYSAARDMDQIRRALREEKITYWAASYGAVLGTAYADLFPERVRTFVLEAPVGPNLDGTRFLRERAANTERAFEAFATACDARPACRARFGGDIRAVFDRAVAQTKTTPLPDPSSGETLNDSQLARWVTLGVWSLPAGSTLLEGIIESVAAGDGSFVGDFIRAMDDPRASAAVAIDCGDHGMPESPGAYTELLPELSVIAPRLGHALLREILPCVHWPSKAREHPSPYAKGAPPILVIGATDDPNTPYSWSEELAAKLDSGVLLTREGGGHGSVSRSISPCVIDAVNAYLLDLTVPPPGTRCPSL
jgi:pimeloyl-ACP methyl ester carboxylesterase